MKKMMRVLIVSALALGLGAVSVQATSLTVGSTEFLGYINPGIPANQTNQVAYLNFLLGVAKGTTVNPGELGNTTVQTYIRTTNDCGVGVDCSSLSASEDGNVRMEWDEQGSTKNTVDFGNGYEFLVGKYGGGRRGGESLVWYVRGMTGEIEIPVKAPNNKGLSSWTLYNPTTRVPDGGMTLMLLGGALIGLEGLRRRFRS